MFFICFKLLIRWKKKSGNKISFSIERTLLGILSVEKESSMQLLFLNSLKDVLKGHWVKMQIDLFSKSTKQCIVMLWIDTGADKTLK